MSQSCEHEALAKWIARKREADRKEWISRLRWNAAESRRLAHAREGERQ